MRKERHFNAQPGEDHIFLSRPGLPLGGPVLGTFWGRL
jgi:hypothetical protein